METNISNDNSDKEVDAAMAVSDQYTACQNCEFDYQKGFAFCPHCGQKTDDDLTVGVLFYNTISNYFSFDARFFKSFIPLMLKPGILAKRFIEGKRLLYLHPAQMYLFISVVFFFLFSFEVRKQVAQVDEQLEKGLSVPVITVDSLALEKALDSANLAEIRNPIMKNEFIPKEVREQSMAALDSLTQVQPEPAGVPVMNFGLNWKAVDSLVAIGAPESEQLAAIGLKEDDGWFKRRALTQILKFQQTKKGGSIVQAFYDSIPIALFILLPIFAIILKLFFWRRGSFAHHLVFGFYYYAFLFTVFSIMLITDRWIWEIPSSISWLIVFSTFFYLILAVRNFYRQSFFVSFIKTSIVTFVYMTFVLPIAAVVMVIAAFMFY
jgi:hypothetical protein